MIKVMEEFPCKKKLNSSDSGQENGTAMIISVSGLSSSIMKKNILTYPGQWGAATDKSPQNFQNILNFRYIW